jgi:hypothetical protein
MLRNVATKVYMNEQGIGKESNNLELSQKNSSGS